MSENFAVSQCCAKTVSDLIIRKVSVDRNRSQQKALDATKRVQYVNYEVVKSMPKGGGDEVELVFFKPHFPRRDEFISDDELEKEFRLRGLNSADPVSVAAVNELTPTFADKFPHGTHWKDADGNWCCEMFYCGEGERRVSVNRYNVDWSALWWFSGIRNFQVS